MDRRQTIQKEIMDLFRNHGKRSFRPKEIVKKLGYSDNTDYRLARAVLEELSQKGEIAAVKGNRFTFRPPAGRMEGRLSVHPSGYGFVAVEGFEQDFFVRSRRMNTAIDGDLVQIGLAARRPQDKRQQAEVLSVLQRKRTSAVGTFKHAGSYAFIIPDDKRLTHDIYVDLDSIEGVNDGDKVKVSIEGFEHRGAAPIGKILSIIGDPNDPSIQTLALAMSLGVEADFKEEVFQEAEAVSAQISRKEISRRLDVRNRTVFTIDPVDAKDFDDALHIHPLSKDRFEVGVHIADVSHYVVPQSELDASALERGTSVYLVDRVIPMLPEALSNDICSLKPDVDRLAFSCIFELDRSGTVHGFKVAETVIRSTHRLAYEDAQAIIEGGQGEHPLAESLGNLQEMAVKLRAKRFKDGSIDFDLQEVRVVLDEKGHPIEIVPRLRQDSNRLIEEFMLLANRNVAAAFGSGDQPFAFRIHEPPDADRIMNLSRYVAAFGLELPHDEGSVNPTDINALLRAVVDRPEAAVVEHAALRAMSKARYDVSNHGHYGLSATHYTHFTSPIRRYPDLIVHRLIKDQMASRKAPESEDLADMLQHCSEREIVATQAERESIKLKKVEFIQDHIGEEYSGVVAGVSKFGVYIELDVLLVEGMVHVRDMSDDYYEYDESSFSLVGSGSGKRYRPGDKVRVLVAGASIENREIDFSFVR